MTDSLHPELAIGDPAPMQRASSLPVIAFALAAGPVLWLMQLLVGFGFASYLCYDDLPRLPGAVAPGWLPALVIAVNLVALAVTAVSVLAGLDQMRRTRQEDADARGGTLEAGEGRARFLAVGATVVAGLFLLASGFNTISLFSVATCPV